MEENKDWFPKKEGTPFIEKIAMLFFGYLFIKYSAKAIKHVIKANKGKKYTWIDYWALMLVSLPFMLIVGMEQGMNRFVVFAVIIIVCFIWALIWEKWFMNNGDPSESKNENEHNL